jgi:DNA invertase Pin-like site-specific DNA recombinase
VTAAGCDNSTLWSSRVEAERRGCCAPVIQAERRNLRSDVKVIGRNGRKWPARQWTAARREAIAAGVKAALAAGVPQTDIATALGISKGTVAAIAKAVPNRRKRGQP